MESDAESLFATSRSSRLTRNHFRMAKSHAEVVADALEVVFVAVPGDEYGRLLIDIEKLLLGLILDKILDVPVDVLH